MAAKTSTAPSARAVISGAALALKARAEEVNRLNVFPVPDGDTGTNMSLTLDAVVADVVRLPESADLCEVCRAATHGSLMGARGNSGVILSQIIRGVCEGLSASEGFEPAERLAASLESAKDIAYQAVRKPVEGTMLTVIADMAKAARAAADAELEFATALDGVIAASHESVRRTPELLPVLKEANVVDAGGFGLAIIFEAAVALILGRAVADIPAFEPIGAGDLMVVPVDDWDDDEYLYCTEFLLFGDEKIDKEKIHDYLAANGGSELIVGDKGQFKVHVHTNEPQKILTYCLKRGELAEVHIHNMRRQQEAREPGGSVASVAGGTGTGATVEHKPVAVIAVSSGPGLTDILTSLGVDVVISGGQTMNPSTKDFVNAARKVSADKILYLPNNKNIIMAAQAAVTALDVPAAVVPTKNVPSAFSAMLAFDPSEGDLDELVETMTEAANEVYYAEITTAIKDSFAAAVGNIKEGDIIGIAKTKDIMAKGSSVEEVAMELLPLLDAAGRENLTLLAGEDFSDEALAALEECVQKAYPDLEVDSQRGDQPLYPLLMACE